MTFLLAASLLFFQSAPQSPIDPLAAARAENRARYQKVELELTRTRLDRLTPEQRAARARLLDVLEAYVDRADFGVQDFEVAARVPQFVDADGRRCAVAELLHATGEDELISTVARGNNTAWIAELSADARFLGWLDRNGLTLDEAARIQAPAMSEPRIPSDAIPSRPTGPSAPTPSAPSTPASPAPDGPARPAPAAGTPGGSAPVAGTPAPASTTPQQQPFGPFSFTDAEASWWLWWEYNKLEFLAPNRFALDTRRDDDVGRTFTSQLDFLRRTIEPVVERLIDHPDARLRAAAAGALGRFGAEGKVEHLLPLVLDANPQVRDAALLGLGASGSREAQLPLMEIARAGRLDGKELSRRTRALAVVALGLGRTCGFDASADEVALAVATQGTPSDRHELGLAAMSYALLAPSDALVELAEKLANDKGLPMALRSRALEVLRARSDSATLAELQHLASGARLELRRSAALTLGEFEHPLASAGLRTAQDLEKEPVANAFLLVSLGRRGGEPARDHLIGALADSQRRPWAALGLGMLAHEHADADVATALLAANAKEPSAETRTALWLALGLTRDPRATSVLIDALQHAAEPRARMYAAQALAIHGSDEGRRALSARLAIERSPLARSQIALALGVLGAREDLESIVATLDSVSEPVLQGQVATAIAFHGSGEAVTKLASLVASDKLDVAARAAAIEGLGMMLSRAPALSLGRTSRSANFTLFPDWLVAACSTTF